MIGFLNHWNRDRGFGFIRTTTPAGIYQDYFTHDREVRSGVPVIGCEASFKPMESLKGLSALEVHFKNAKLTVSR